LCDGEIDIGELIIGEEEGPATGDSLVGEVVADGMGGRGRIPDEEIDLPLPLPSGLLPSFREIGADSSGTGRLEVVIARGGFAT
jgi:hypothetical protein